MQHILNLIRRDSNEERLKFRNDKKNFNFKNAPIYMYK
jgi:hypothetical protein